MVHRSRRSCQFKKQACVNTLLHRVYMSANFGIFGSECGFQEE